MHVPISKVTLRAAIVSAIAMACASEERAVPAQLEVADEPPAAPTPTMVMPDFVALPSTCPDPESDVVDAVVAPGFGLVIAEEPGARVDVVLPKGRRSKVADMTCVVAEYVHVPNLMDDDSPLADHVDVELHGAQLRVLPGRLLLAHNSSMLVEGRWRLFFPAVETCGGNDIGEKRTEIYLLGHNQRWLLERPEGLDGDASWIRSAVAAGGHHAAVVTNHRMLVIHLERGTAMSWRMLEEPSSATDGTLFARDLEDVVYEIKEDGYAMPIANGHSDVYEENPKPMSVSADATLVTIPRGPAPSVVVHRYAWTDPGNRFMSLLEGPADRLVRDATGESSFGSLAPAVFFDAKRARYVYTEAVGDDAVVERARKLADELAAATDMPMSTPGLETLLVATELLVAGRKQARLRFPAIDPVLERLELATASLETEDERRCHAAFVLASAGRPVELRVPTARDSLLCQASFALAFAAHGDAETAKSIVPLVREGAATLAADAGLDGANFDRALALMALVELAAGDAMADDLARALMQRRAPAGWESPAETAMALHALTRWAASGPKKAAFESAIQAALDVAWTEHAVRLSSTEPPDFGDGHLFANAEPSP